MSFWGELTSSYCDLASVGSKSSNLLVIEVIYANFVLPAYGYYKEENH